MGTQPARTRRPWRTVAGITSYVVVLSGGITALAASGADPVAVLVLAAAAITGLVVVLTHTLGHAAASLRRVASDTAVIVDANPAHRVAPARSQQLEPLVTELNRLAERREVAERRAAERADLARQDVEHERNRLAALMADLTVAVIVCNSEGRTLLYNQEALSLVGDTAAVGLGRSVFGLIDRGLVVHAQERLAEGTDAAYTATTLWGDRLLRVRIARVNDHGTGTDASGGFVLVLEDLTAEARAGDERERVRRELTESARSSLQNLRAATESVQDLPETNDEGRRLLDVVRREADRLGEVVEDLATPATGLADTGLLAEIAGDDLLGIVRSRLAGAGIGCAAVFAGGERVWLRVDGHAIARTVVHLVTRLRRAYGVADVALELASHVPHAQLDVRWRGSGPSEPELEAWLDEPLAEDGTSTARDVAERHGAEVESAAADADADSHRLRVLIPLAAGLARAANDMGRVEVGSRPEFYDFDLFTSAAQPPDHADLRLDEASFTVFDTETTGLDPAGGDRVISLGAVRVVNGRVLRQETFERLVQPGRSVPVASTAIHGITSEMLQGQPRIEEVLPSFARFAEDTVLVGHNISFDLQFLKMAEPAAGIQLTQPALDTLLLHAALDPEGDEHSLEAIANRLGVSVVGRHTALGDALVTAEVFVGLVAMLRGRGIETLGDAMAVARRTYQARVEEKLYGS